MRHIRVPDDLWQAAKRKAHDDSTTLSAVIVEALRRYVRDGDYFRDD